jgi:hypothetical protein
MEEAFIDTGRAPGTNGTCFGTWPSGASRYLGLQFSVNGEAHFGWARLNVTCENLHVIATLTGYAYETVANKAIVAGETKGADEEAGAVLEDSVSEPARKATLGLLALGSQSLLIFRREENQ